MRFSRSIPTVLAGALALLAFSAVPALAVAPEKPVTEAAGEVTATTATLHGELNPGAEASVGYQFIYYTEPTCEYGFSTEPVAEAKVAAGSRVSTPVTGLEPDREYTFCVQATHLEGETLETTDGQQLKFKTLALKPTLGTENPTKYSGLTPFAATLEAEVNANNEETKYVFTLATDKALTTNVKTYAGTLEAFYYGASASVSTGTVLQSNTTYYYQLVAENATGKTEGPVESFTTLEAKAPEVLGENASNLNSSEPRLEANINPEYQETGYHFEYATKGTEGVGGTLEGPITTAPVPPATDLPAVFEEPGLLAGPVGLKGLVALPAYYYRVVATNGTGTTTGPVQSFPTYAAPVLGTGATTVVADGSASVTSSVTAQGRPTSYRFVYIDQAGYEQGLAATPAEPYALAKRSTTTGLTGPNGETLADYAAHTVEVPLSELTPGTTYHYALIAENELGRTVGPDQTFTTTGTPPTEPGPEAEIPGPAPQTSPFPAATLPPVIPYTSIAALDAKEAKEGKGSTPVTKSLTRSEKLAKALKACEKQAKSKRAGCRRQAQAKYGPVGTKKRTKKK